MLLRLSHLILAECSNATIYDLMISLYPPRAEVDMANRVIFGILRTGYRLISTEAKPRLISVDIDRGEAEVNIATDINRGVAEVDIT